MRKLVLSISIVLFAVQIVFAQQNGFTIKGKINGLKDGYQLILSKIEKYRSLDTSVLTKGVFQFKGKVAEPHKAIIRVYKPGEDRVENSLQFYLDNSDYQLETDYENFCYAMLTGSKVNDAYNLLVKENLEYQKLIDEKRDMRNPEAKLDKEQREEIHKLSAEAKEKYSVAKKRFVDENTDTYPALDILIRYAEINEIAKRMKGYKLLSSRASEDELRQYYQKLSPKLQNSVKGKALFQQLFGEVAKEGKRYIEFEETFTMDGRPFKVSDVKTDYVLLDFTGVHCCWCKKFNKAILPYYQKIKDKVEIVSFYTNTNKDWIVSDIKKGNIPWVVVTDLKGDYSINKKRYQVHGLPDFFLLDKDRKIIKHVVGYNEEFIKDLTEL